MKLPKILYDYWASFDNNKCYILLPTTLIFRRVRFLALGLHDRARQDDLHTLRQGLRHGRRKRRPSVSVQGKGMQRIKLVIPIGNFKSQPLQVTLSVLP